MCKLVVLILYLLVLMQFDICGQVVSFKYTRDLPLTSKLHYRNIESQIVDESSNGKVCNLSLLSSHNDLEKGTNKHKSLYTLFKTIDESPSSKCLIINYIGDKILALSINEKILVDTCIYFSDKFALFQNSQNQLLYVGDWDRLVIFDKYENPDSLLKILDNIDKINSEEFDYNQYSTFNELAEYFLNKNYEELKFTIVNQNVFKRAFSCRSVYSIINKLEHLDFKMKYCDPTGSFTLKFRTSCKELKNCLSEQELKDFEFLISKLNEDKIPDSRLLIDFRGFLDHETQNIIEPYLQKRKFPEIQTSLDRLFLRNTVTLYINILR